MVLVDFASLTILAYVLIARMGVANAVVEHVALAFALALGLKSLLLFVCIALGVRPDIWVQTSLSLTALYGAAVFILLRKQAGSVPAPREKKSRVAVLPVAILGLLVVLSVANALYFPITEVDGIWYELRGRVFLQEVRFDSNTLNDQFRQYPPFIPLLYAYLIEFGIPSVKLLFPLLYLCLLTLFFFRVQQETRNRKLAAAFTLVLGSTPYFWWHSTLPFLDLATAFYFSIGALYWFSLVRKTEDGPRHAGEPEPVSTALLSGALFGLAAWNRPEFLLYGFIPLAVWILVLNQDGRREFKERRRLLLAFAAPLLFLPTLWLVTLLGFESSLERRIPALALACAAQWGLVVVFSVFPLALSRKVLAWMCAAAALLFFWVVYFFGPQSVSTGQALLIAFSRTLSVQIFYSFSIFLAIFLFLENGKDGLTAQRWLKVFLLLYLCVHFMLFSYSEPRWTGLNAFFEATFLTPGRSVNLSDTRGMMAWYPVFLFFIARLPVMQGVFAADRKRWGRGFVYGVTVCNLLVLAGIFILPRLVFMVEHSGFSHAQRLETTGPSDMPNQFAGVYRRYAQAREPIPAQARVFVPPSDGPKGTVRAPVLQILYPRTVHFGDDPDFAEQLERARSGTADFYFVYDVDWHTTACEEMALFKDERGGWGVCRFQPGVERAGSF